jgi:protein-disulfide isomerase
MKIINYLIKSVVFGIIISNCCLAFAATFTSEQNTAIEQVVHDYLIKKPEVLVEAMKILQQKQMTQMEQESKKLLDKNAKEIFDPVNRPIAGNAKGNIVITELFDYRCSHCKSMDSVIKKIIHDNSDVKVIYLEAPIFGKESAYISKVALAAMKQNKYLELHTVLLNDSSNAATKDEVFKIAKISGVDVVKLEKDMEDNAIEKQLTANVMLLKKMKIPGTPAFFIANVKNKKYDVIYGQFGSEVLQQKIDAVK